MHPSKLITIAAIALAVALFFSLGLDRYLTLDELKRNQAALEAMIAARPLGSTAVYALIYIAVTGLSLPGATVLTLAGGAVFGLLWGTLIVSFASTIGATLAFLAARFLFRDAVKARFGERLRVIDEGVEKDGPFYLLTLRLIPLFPFFMINLAMGLTAIRLRTFYWVSQAGMLAGTVVYVNAGTQLARIESLADIASPALLGSFALLGVFPLFAKKIVDSLQAMKIYRNWPKPERFDNNLVVIGAGSGGLVTAYIAAALKAKVTLIEKHNMGGDCLNTGCVPSKALIRSAHWMSFLKRAEEFGFKRIDAEVDFPAVMARVQSVIEKVAPHDSIARYQSLGVDVLIGNARIVSPWAVEVATEHGRRQLTTRAIVIAAGAHPFVPDLPGSEDVEPLTSDTIWNLRTLPERLLILGGGPMGCEFAQSFARLGSRVTLLEAASRLLPREEPEASEAVMSKFRSEGIELRLGHTATAWVVENGEKILIAEQQGQTVRIAFDEVLIAIGRAANVEGYGVDALAIRLTERKTVATDPFQQTNYPNIYAVGDVAGPYQLTHVAAHQAWTAAVNALFGQFKRFRTDYSVIPWATFTEPEVARVGLSEQEAQRQNIRYETVRYGIDDLDRAIADGEADGFVKVLTKPGSDKILGVTIVGAHAGDLIAEFVLAMKHGIGLNKILGTIHIYPTMAEANKYAAGAWKKAHAPQSVLRLLERFHRWRRN